MADSDWTVKMTLKILWLTILGRQSEAVELMREDLNRLYDSGVMTESQYEAGLKRISGLSGIARRGSGKS